MTNSEIILSEMNLRGITEEVNTFASWKAQGYSINKGEKAAFKTKIWKPVKLKDKETGERAEKATLILVDACFFTLSQVTKIKKEVA